MSTGMFQVPRHAADHHRLLEVLLAEKGQVGLHHVEEFWPHGGYAPEVSGPESPAEGLGQTTWFNVGLEAGGVDLAETSGRKSTPAPASRHRFWSFSRSRG